MGVIGYEMKFLGNQFSRTRWRGEWENGVKTWMGRLEAGVRNYRLSRGVSVLLKIEKFDMNFFLVLSKPRWNLKTERDNLSYVLQRGGSHLVRYITLGNQTIDPHHRD